MSERLNASTFLLHTTVRPFIFMGSSFKCFYCFEYFKVISSLLEHTVKHKVPEHKVLLQKYFYKGKRAILVDISRLSCRICNDGSEFPNLEAIKEHLKVEHRQIFHAGTTGMIEFELDYVNGMLKCHICTQEFMIFAQLHRHMNSNHLTRSVCDVCGEGFSNQQTYLLHKDNHKKPSVKCQFCDKAFYNGGQMRYHIRVVHRGFERAKRTQCPFCLAVFEDLQGKVNHLKEVHGIYKDFPCHLCKAQFDTRPGLTDHVSTEHTQKFRCDQCNKFFATEYKLKLHMLKHSREKNFVCKICNNAYMHQKSLNYHMRLHGETGDPVASLRIVCATCGMGFSNKTEYTKHMKLWHFFGEADAYETDENLFFQL